MAENESVDRVQNTSQHLASPLSKAVSFLSHGPIPPAIQTMPEEQEQQHQQRLSPLCNGFFDKAPKLQAPEGSLRSISNGRGSIKAPSPRVSSNLSTGNTSGQNGFPHKFASESASEQDVPLDFSLRRRESTSESLSDDSRASSTASPKNFVPSSGLVPESRDSHFLYYNPSQRENYLNHANLDNDQHIRNSSEARRSPCSSPENEQPIGQLTRASSMSGVTGGRFDMSPEQSDKTSMAVRTPAAVFGQNGSILGPLGNLSTALMMDPRRLQSGNGRKMQRPFKAYPKEALQMPIGYLGQPNFSSFAGMDHNPMQGLTVSQEELVTIYKQQLDLLKERDKQLLNANKPLSGSISSPSSTSPSASSNGSTHSAQQPPSSHTTSHSNQAVPTLVHPVHPASTPSLFTSAPTSASPAIPLGTSHSSVLSNISSMGQFTPPSTHSLVSSTSSNSGMRKRPRTLPEEQKDEAYWERRRKNNDAAKRSRDARRAKEDEIAIRAALLEQENLKLRVEVAALKTETARLRCMLYNS